MCCIFFSRKDCQLMMSSMFADERYMTVLPSCTAGAAMLLGISVHCDTATTRAAYACLSNHLPAVSPVAAMSSIIATARAMHNYWRSQTACP